MWHGMRASLLSGVAAAALATSTARAADLPVKAPAAVLSWTGVYAGINAGAGIGVNSDTDNVFVSSTALGPNGLLSTADKHASPGAVVGGQIGYNRQLSSHWLVGLEADWQWTSQKNASSACTPPASLAFFGAGATTPGFGYCLADESKLNRLRYRPARAAGVLIHDTLWYATGGAAWGTVKDDFAFGGTANATIFPGALQPGPFLPGGGSFSRTKVGWTVGAGVETKLDSHWSAKLEYVYVDLGSVDETFAIPINPAFGPAFTTGSATATRSSRITDNIVRIGLNYHLAPFGSDEAASGGFPVKAPMPRLSWTGVYAGINAGAGIGVNSDTDNAFVSSAALGPNGLLSTADKHASPGAVVGGQIGYNRQLSSHWLVGLEADWQWTSQKNASSACTPPASLAFFGAGANGFGYCLADESKLTDFGTARARGGVLIHDTLWYATGGAAWGTVKDDFAFGGTANATIFPGALQPGPFLPGGGSFSRTKVGWTVGAGVETKLDSHWSAKLEYVYVDLGSVDETFAIPINPAFGPAFTTGSATATRSSRITDNIVRIGLNYALF